MKDEIILKLKKAAKIGGLIAGFLATFILGMGFGSCSEKKLQDQSSQKQSQSKRVAPKMALDPAKNLLNYAEFFGSRFVHYYVSSNTLYSGVDSEYNCWLIPRGYMPEGASYVVTYEGNLITHMNGLSAVIGVANAIKQGLEAGNNNQWDSSLASRSNLITSSYTSPFVVNLPSGFYRSEAGQGGSNIVNACLCLASRVTGVYLVEESYYLNNADGIALTFGENWLPYGVFTQWASGNLGIAINNFGDSATTQNTLIEAAFDDLLFTCGDGFGYNGLRIVARPLWDGAKYVNQAGEVKTYSFSTANEYIPLVINYVDYKRFDTGAWVRVANYSLRINEDGTQIAIDPPLAWQSDLYKSPRFFRYPAGFVYPTWKISSDVGAHWSTWQPSRPPQGLTFFDWFSLRGEDIAIGNPFGNDGSNVFTLISSGFTAVLPIFNVQVLPYLTIGTLLFAPLVILLIFAILKVLNK